jgi:hypothetical protein
MIAPEVGEIRGHRFDNNTDCGCLSVYAWMRSGKIVRFHRAPLEESELDRPFDCDERGFDDECIVCSIVQGFSTSEQPTGLPQLEDRCVFHVESGLDFCRSPVERRLCVVNQLFDSRTTHR